MGMDVEIVDWDSVLCIEEYGNCRVVHFRVGIDSVKTSRSMEDLRAALAAHRSSKTITWQPYFTGQQPYIQIGETS